MPSEEGYGKKRNRGIIRNAIGLALGSRLLETIPTNQASATDRTLARGIKTVGYAGLLSNTVDYIHTDKKRRK